ncbi:hypothetical protein [Mycobacterium colombiense]|nr:hypothetical protein [Mycobacterium colombiense]
MGSVIQDKDPTISPDWQVLLSIYVPLVFYGAACIAGRVSPRPEIGERR